MSEQTKTVKMVKAKETPGTFTYTTNEAGTASRSIYVNKGTWDPMPEAVIVTVTPAAK